MNTMTAQPSSTYPDDIASLTGLRFIAAAWVFLYHVHIFFKLPPGLGDFLMSKGYLGVDFFFILSGFILTHVYAPQWRAGRVSKRTFWGYRLARIYPLHFLTLLIAGMLGVVHATGWDAATTWPYFFANLFLVSGWGHSPDLSFNQPAWSISAEWFAYLCFPFLLAFLIRLDRVRAVLYAGAFYAAIVLMSFNLFGREITAFTSSFNMLRIMPEFCLGMALYHLSSVSPWRASQWIPWLLFVLLLIGLAQGLPDFVSILIMAAIICAVAGGMARKANGVLAHPVMVYLGEISYGFYMVHVLVLYGAWRLWNNFGGLWLWAGLAFVGTIAVAAVLYHFYEVPARRFVRRFTRTRNA